MLFQKRKMAQAKEETEDYNEEAMEFDIKADESNAEQEPEGAEHAAEDAGLPPEEAEQPPNDAEETQEQQRPPVQLTRNVMKRAQRSTTPAKSTVASQPVTQSPKANNNGDRICLVAKIDRALHSRLKIQSYRTHKSIVEMVEEWIAQSCPEE